MAILPVGPMDLPTDASGHLGGDLGEIHTVVCYDSDGPGGSSVPSDPNLSAGSEVAMVANSDHDVDDRY